MPSISARTTAAAALRSPSAHSFARRIIITVHFCLSGSSKTALAAFRTACVGTASDCTSIAVERRLRGERLRGELLELRRRLGIVDVDGELDADANVGVVAGAMSTIGGLIPKRALCVATKWSHQLRN